MKLANSVKWGILAAVLLCALLLSGCYMSPDTTTGGSGGTADGNTFASVAPAPTETATPVTTNEPANNETGGVGQVNWDNDDQWTPSATVTTGTSNNGQTAATATPAATATAKTTTSGDTSTVLKNGSSGSAVSQLQQRLKELEYYSGSVDGEFGSGTETAVREFQKNNGLNVDGKAGTKTLEAVYDYYAVANPNPSGSSSSSSTAKATATATKKATATATPKATATPVVSDNTYLKLGSTGSKVTTMQERLISLGYLAGKADGTFGEATEAAVKAFQKRNCPYVDGIAGPETLRTLYSSSAKSASSVTSVINQTLSEGDEGPAVRALQTRLKELGYLTGSVDGSFGSATKAAVIAFQQNNGLNADGKAGTATFNKLYADDVVNARGASSSTATATSTGTTSSSTGYTTLKSGDSGDGVKKLQQQLKELGFYTGSVDGSYGAGTVSAVTAFQTASKITADGIAGPTTQRLLYGGNASSADTKSLKLYDEGSAVTNLQYALYELGYYQSTINDIYTVNTQNAVREFQMNNGLTVDGVAGTKTLEVLYSAYAKPAAVETATYTTVQLGDTGEDVVLVQDALYQLGYTTRKATGTFDEETQQALKSFQQNNGLTADGIAGAATQQKLYSDSAVKNPSSGA